MSAYDDLLAERYSRATHAWWKTPARTLVEDVAATQRRMLIRASEEIDATVTLLPDTVAAVKLTHTERTGRVA